MLKHAYQDQHEQGLEGIFDSHPALLTASFGNDLLVVLLEIGAQRILQQQALHRCSTDWRR